MKPPPRHPFKEAFIQTLESLKTDSPCLTKLRGNIQKRALILAPAPTEGDMIDGLPLSDPKFGFLFHEKLFQLADLNTQTDFIVMAGSPIVTDRPTKKMVEPFRELLKANKTRFDLIVCIGAPNFKFYFGRGKKSSMQTLASGNPVFLTFDWPDLPIFVIPEISGLGLEETGDSSVDWKIKIVRAQCERWLERILPGLGQAYKTYVK